MDKQQGRWTTSGPHPPVPTRVGWNSRHVVRRECSLSTAASTCQREAEGACGGGGLQQKQRRVLAWMGGCAGRRMQAAGRAWRQREGALPQGRVCWRRHAGPRCRAQRGAWWAGRALACRHARAVVARSAACRCSGRRRGCSHGRGQPCRQGATQTAGRRHEHHRASGCANPLPSGQQRQNIQGTRTAWHARGQGQGIALAQSPGRIRGRGGARRACAGGGPT